MTARLAYLQRFQFRSQPGLKVLGILDNHSGRLNRQVGMDKMITWSSVWRTAKTIKNLKSVPVLNVCVPPLETQPYKVWPMVDGAGGGKERIISDHEGLGLVVLHLNIWLSALCCFTSLQLPNKMFSLSFYSVWYWLWFWHHVRFVFRFWHQCGGMSLLPIVNFIPIHWQLYRLDGLFLILSNINYFNHPK